MDVRSATSLECEISFGPFRLFPARRLLLEGDTPLRLGSRAVAVLVVLVERAGELVTKGELMERVWPDTVVEEANLKVHISALRRILGDRETGRRYVTTVSGRGYSFVAPIQVSEPETQANRREVKAESANNLPASQTRVFGRAETLNTLQTLMRERRFVTLVGAGGIGKTTVALALAEALLPAYEHGIWIVDLAPVGQPQFVPGALAATLGLSILSENVMPGLLDHLQGKEMLVVLDSCEHVTGAAAALAEQILKETSGVSILTTSREPLRAKGERVHRLSPLELPASSSGLTVAEAAAFPAIQLFVDRAVESLDGFELSDADAPVVADICRKLDGIPLAIELAASRIDAFGLRQLLTLLDDRFRILGPGRRTALPRHQTLTAAIDWSYDLLPQQERVVLLRLSVFAGMFTLDSAKAVAADVSTDVVESLANLVAKSLIWADLNGPLVQYRLFDSTRAYAMQKLSQIGELAEYVRRHALHHRDLFEKAEAEWESDPTSGSLGEHGRKIEDVRNALNWAFSPVGDASVGVTLTVACIPIWMHLSLIDELREWVERAIASHLAEPTCSERQEMKLYTALGTYQLFALKPLTETAAVWTRALGFAEKLKDGEYQLRAIWGLCVYQMYSGDFRSGLALAERFCAAADKKDDTVSRLVGDRLAGRALHYLGNHKEAQLRLDRMLIQYVAPVQSSHISPFQFDHRSAAQSTLSSVLWVRGFPDQAMRNALDALSGAQRTGHPISLCIVLAHAACPIALNVGDLDTAERLIALLIDHSARHALSIWNVVGLCFKGALSMAQGDSNGLAPLRAGINQLHEAGLGFRYTAFLSMLAQGQAATGRTVEASNSIEQALERSDRTEERWNVAELLRIKSDILLLRDGPAAAPKAEALFHESLAWARRQEALSWELRTSISLARFLRNERRADEARDLLTSVYDRFAEGWETLDLRTAKQVIQDLN